MPYWIDRGGRRRAASHLKQQSQVRHPYGAGPSGLRAPGVDDGDRRGPGQVPSELLRGTGDQTLVHGRDAAADDEPIDV